jgi:hypothetical protein
MPTVRIEYYGVEGQGKNLKEAKRDAGAKIEKALTGSYGPQIVSYRGYAILVFRKPEGWCTQIIADADTGVREGAIYAGANHATEKEALKNAFEHLADLGWEENDGHVLPYFLTDRDSIATYKSKVEFWIRCKEARRIGIPEKDIHDWACKNPWRPELWQTPAAAQ